MKQFNLENIIKLFRKKIRRSFFFFFSCSIRKKTKTYEQYLLKIARRLKSFVYFILIITSA